MIGDVYGMQYELLTFIWQGRAIIVGKLNFSNNTDINKEIHSFGCISYKTKTVISIR